MTHTVMRGDTLFKIAERYSTTVSAIKRANPIIKDVDVIKVGWVLTIPTATGESDLREALTTCLSDIEQLDSFKRVKALIEG